MCGSKEGLKSHAACATEEASGKKDIFIQPAQALHPKPMTEENCAHHSWISA